MSTLSINHVNFSYSTNQKQVIHNLTWNADGSESIGIVGANGAGKSTLLKLLTGLQLDFEGEILVNDLPVNKKTLKQIRNDIGYVFQDSDSQLFMSRVWDDVAFGPQNHGYTEQEVYEKTLNALKQVNIEHLRDQQIYRLSGGEKKLVTLATVLAYEPDILLFDEPTVALDPANRRNLIHLLNSLSGMKIIASHDLDFIYDTCQRTILINNGRIVKDGNTKEILRDKKLLEDNGLELPLSLSRMSESVDYITNNNRLN
nr:ABC transporter ATP-binding protein [uncultured Carboxylicivirga sp.]